MSNESHDQEFIGFKEVSEGKRGTVGVEELDVLIFRCSGFLAIAIPTSRHLQVLTEYVYG